MPTLNLQVATSLGDSHSGSTANDAGRNVTASAVVTANSASIEPGSHGANDEYTAGIRFPSIPVPKGATIISASLILTASGTYTPPNPVVYHVSGQAADNAAALSTTSGNLNVTARPRTTADAGPWSLASVTLDVEYTRSITAVIQEIVDRAGWADKNAMVLLLDTHADTAAGEWHTFFAFNGSAAKAPKLQIVWSDNVNDGAQRDQRRHPTPVMRRIAA